VKEIAINMGSPPSSALYPLGGDADFAMRTGDGVSFGLHHAILRRASLVMTNTLFVGDSKPDADSTPGTPALANLKLKLEINSYPGQIEEDSKTLEDLLSFIYPDRQAIVFEELDPFLNVLKAAAKYQMKVVINALTEQVRSSQLKGNVMYQPLIYKDPLRVCATAKHLAIERLFLIAREATLTVDIHQTTRSEEASAMPASWLWDLEDTRRERRKWLIDFCETSTPVYSPDFASSHAYPRSRASFLDSEPKSDCRCSEDSPEYDDMAIPAHLLKTIKDFPCPKSIREIDFNMELECLRCGGAATAFFKRVCEDYEAKFGVF